MKSILPHLPEALIREAFAKAAGNELESGKLESPQSSAALAANVFGYFLSPGKADQFPRSGHFSFLESPVQRVDIERSLRFPWSGGRHPWLDAVLETDNWIVGIESKRFEPFRDVKEPYFSEAYDKSVWGSEMTPYIALMAQLRNGTRKFRYLNAAQLIKHAFGIRTQAQEKVKLRRPQRKPALVYLYAEPRAIPGDRPISKSEIEEHRNEISEFGRLVSGADVRFSALTHSALLEEFTASPYPDLQAHAALVTSAFLSDQFT
jgi:hypothetical protein